MEEYRPQGWRTTAAMIGLGLEVLGSLALDLWGLAGGAESEDPGQALAGAGVGLLLIVSMVLGTVFFLMWFHRAAANARTFGREGLKFTPGWCVGWWFIPIANLFKPFQAMREVWLASDPQVGNEAPGAWSQVAAPGLLSAWWGTFVIGNVLNNLSGRMEEEPTSSLVGLAGTIVLAVCAFFAVRIIRELDRRQEAARSLSLSSTFE
jgi:hypothetical protein